MRVLLKPAHSPDGSQSVALCWSEGRTEKDRAIRQKQEIRFLADTEKLQKRIVAAACGHLPRFTKPSAGSRSVTSSPATILLPTTSSNPSSPGAKTSSANRKPNPTMAVTCSKAAATTSMPKTSGATTSC